MLKLFVGGKSWPLRHRPYLGGIWHELSLLHQKHQEEEKWQIEVALLCFNKKLVLEKMWSTRWTS